MLENCHLNTYTDVCTYFAIDLNADKVHYFMKH
jgi:hypothetical protein